MVAGFTVRLPLASTLPMPEITTRRGVRRQARQHHRDCLESCSRAGFAVKDVMVGGAGGVGGRTVTLMVTLAVTDPKLLVAVRV